MKRLINVGKCGFMWVCVIFRILKNDIICGFMWVFVGKIHLFYINKVDNPPLTK